MIGLQDIIIELEEEKEKTVNELLEQEDTIMVYRLTGYLQGIGVALKLVEEAHRVNERI